MGDTRKPAPTIAGHFRMSGLGHAIRGPAVTARGEVERRGSSGRGDRCTIAQRCGTWRLDELDPADLGALHGDLHHAGGVNRILPPWPVAWIP